MSADNWAICPRCRARAAAVKDALIAKLAEAYGKVPVEEFDALRAEAEEPLHLENLQTFREDYEFYGAEDGVVTASYSGSCKTCGLSLSFKDEHPIPGLAGREEER